MSARCSGRAVIGELERRNVFSFNGKSDVYKVPKAKK